MACAAYPTSRTAPRNRGESDDSFRGGLRKIRNLCAIEEIPFGRDARRLLTEAWGKPGIELLEAGLGVSRALAEKMNQQWIRLDNADPPELIPGTREMLYWLRQNGFKSALLTSRWRDGIHGILERYDLTKEFAGICTREDVPYFKPDPRSLRPPLELLADKFGITQDECIFVGDTPSDIEAGHLAGIETLVVQTGPYLLKHSHKTFGGKLVSLANVLASVDDLPLWIEQNHEGTLTRLYD